VRLHGSQALYTSDYSDDELSMWAAQTTRWLRNGCDVYVYFDNDAHVHAPYNAIWLESLVREVIASRQSVDASAGTSLDRLSSGHPVHN